MSIYGNITDRFDILDFEPAKEYLKRKEKERKKFERKHQEYKRKVEKEWCCQGCEKKGKNRWVRNGEFFLCYGCFIHDLDCESSVMVPSRRACDLEDYMDLGIWEELWKNGK